MNIYLISQEVNPGYDTYDSVVVVAENEEEARSTKVGYNYPKEWALPKFVQVELIGRAEKDVSPGIVIASYNAG